MKSKTVTLILIEIREQGNQFLVAGRNVGPGVSGLPETEAEILFAQRICQALSDNLSGLFRPKPVTRPKPKLPPPAPATTPSPSAPPEPPLP